MNGRTASIAVTAVTGLLLGAAVVNAGVVFSDDFESPDVPATYNQANTSKTASTNWVRAASGFGADRNGLVDEAYGNFTDPAGEQAYTFRYTNSGVTTVEGLIGALTAGTTYTVSFDVVLDGYNSGDGYHAALVTFDAGATRSAVEFMSKNTSAVLEELSGTYSGTTYANFSFSYTADAIDDAAVIGHDVALRFDGATSSAIIDNVVVSVDSGDGGGDPPPAVPTPAALPAGLLLLGVVAMHRRLTHASAA